MAYCGELYCWQSPCPQHGLCGVKFISKRSVQCADPQSLKKVCDPFKLGPFDSLVLPIVPIAVVYVYKSIPPSRPEPLIPLDRLEHALSLLLNYYPQLTGRLFIKPKGFREISALGTGAELYSAECLDKLDKYSVDGRIELLHLPHAGNALFPPLNLLPDFVSREPLLAIQHTRFACGSVCLGVRLLHTVCDAEGFFQLVQDLAELYRGGPAAKLTIEPYITSWYSELSTATEQEQELSRSFKPRQLIVPVNQPISSDEKQNHSKITGRVIHFSVGELELLKAQATDASKGWITTFEALAVHIWQSVFRARLHLQASLQSPELHSDFLTPFNWRHRDRLHLPPRYFGNALSTLVLVPSNQQLASASRPELAMMLHENLRAQDKQEQDLTLRWIMAQPEISKIQSTFRYGNGGIMLSEWSKFDLYGGAVFDFDDNEKILPTLVSTPFTPISLMDGLGYFLPTREQGSNVRAIDVNLALIEPLWAILDADPDFCGLA